MWVFNKVYSLQFTEFINSDQRTVAAMNVTARAKMIMYADDILVVARSKSELNAWWTW